MADVKLAQRHNSLHSDGGKTKSEPVFCILFLQFELIFQKGHKFQSIPPVRLIPTHVLTILENGVNSL